MPNTDYHGKKQTNTHIRTSLSISKERLAYFGGPKIRPTSMPARMAFGEEELEVVQEVFEHYRRRKVDFGYQGHFEQLYTEAFVRYLEADGFADAVCTGTAALFVGLAALQLPPESHVLVSPITDPGTINAIILNRLVPVLVDSMPYSYNMGPEQFEERITDETKAVVVVHAGGKAAPIDEIYRIAHNHRIYVVEDCSQAHGARVRGQKVGTFGDIAAFSTMYRKAHSTGGCGGVVFTSNEHLYHMIRAYADRGKPFWLPDFNEKDPTTFLFPAMNLNLDEISCAIGMKLLAKLDDTICRRVNFLQQLHDSILRCSAVCRPSPVLEDDSPFFFPVFVDSSQISCSKKDFALAVNSEGIDLNPHYMYVVSEWAYAKPYLADSFECPNVIQCRDNSFNILFNENYGHQEAQDITTAIIKVEEFYHQY